MSLGEQWWEALAPDYYGPEVEMWGRPEEFRVTRLEASFVANGKGLMMAWALWEGDFDFLLQGNQMGVAHVVLSPLQISVFAVSVSLLPAKLFVQLCQLVLALTFLNGLINSFLGYILRFSWVCPWTLLLSEDIIPIVSGCFLLLFLFLGKLCHLTFSTCYPPTHPLSPPVLLLSLPLY